MASAKPPPRSPSCDFCNRCMGSISLCEVAPGLCQQCSDCFDAHGVPKDDSWAIGVVLLVLAITGWRVLL